MSRRSTETRTKPPSAYRPLVPAVEQAIRLLTCLAESSSEQLTLTEICARLDLHKSKGYTLLNTLKQYDFIERNDQTKTYRLGLGIVYLARNILNNLDIRNLVLPFLGELAERSTSTAHYGTISGSRLYIVARRNLREDLDYGLREGSNYHLTHGSHGKAIAAFMPEAECEQLLARDSLEFYGEGQPVDFTKLREELRKCRQEGYAIDPGETNAGMNVISAPVFNHNGQVIGCIILTGTFARSKLGAFGPLVAQTARRISSKLGWEARSAR